MKMLISLEYNKAIKCLEFKLNASISNTAYFGILTLKLLETIFMHTEQISDCYNFFFPISAWVSGESYFAFALIRRSIIKKPSACLLHLSVEDHLLK